MTVRDMNQKQQQKNVSGESSPKGIWLSVKEEFIDSKKRASSASLSSQIDFWEKNIYLHYELSWHYKKQAYGM